MLQVGDPSRAGHDHRTDGPRRPARRAARRRSGGASTEGARLVTGGRAIDGPGCYVEPTVLDGVGPGMTAFVEETFGPVAAVARARDDDHAVELANDTTFGLGASVWGSPDHALAVGSSDPLGRALRQRDGRLGPAASVRRHRPQRLRPRAVGRGHPRVHQRAHGRGRLMRFDHVGINVADLPAMTDVVRRGAGHGGRVRVRAGAVRVQRRDAAQLGRLPRRAPPPGRERGEASRCSAPWTRR